MNVGFPLEAFDVLEVVDAFLEHPDAGEAAEAAEVLGVIAVEDDAVESAGPVFEDALDVLDAHGEFGAAAVFDEGALGGIAGGEEEFIGADEAGHGDFAADGHLDLEGGAEAVFEVAADVVGGGGCIGAFHLGGGDAVGVDDAGGGEVDDGVGDEAGFADEEAEDEVGHAGFEVGFADAAEAEVIEPDEAEAGVAHVALDEAHAQAVHGDEDALVLGEEVAQGDVHDGALQDVLLGRLDDLAGLLDPAAAIGHGFGAVGGVVGGLQLGERDVDDFGSELLLDGLAVGGVGGMGIDVEDAGCAEAVEGAEGAEGGREVGEAAGGVDFDEFALALPAGDGVPFVAGIGEAEEDDGAAEFHEGLEVTADAHGEVEDEDAVDVLELFARGGQLGGVADQSGVNELVVAELGLKLGQFGLVALLFGGEVDLGGGPTGVLVAEVEDADAGFGGEAEVGAGGGAGEVLEAGGPGGPEGEAGGGGVEEMAAGEVGVHVGR